MWWADGAWQGLLSEYQAVLKGPEMRSWLRTLERQIVGS
jgi:hypothetical protein